MEDTEDDVIALLEARLAETDNVRTVEVSAPVAVQPEVIVEASTPVEVKQVVAVPVAEVKEETRLEQRIRSIKEAVEEYHPGAWSFDKITDDSIPMGSAKYCITIHFPELHLDNSRDDKHTIYDLYVRMCFDDSMNHLRGWWGSRGTLTYAEYQSGYAHSHLSSSSVQRGARKMTKFTEFCLGDGPISNLVYGLSGGWGIEDFKSSLLYLHTYVVWESLEGGPYHKMVNIRVSSSTIQASPAMGHIDKAFKDYIAHDATKIELKLNESNPPQFEVNNLIALETELIEFTGFRQFKDPTGKYLDLSTSSNIPAINADIAMLNSNSVQVFIFKGEPVIVKIIPLVDPKEVNKTNLVAHSRIIIGVKERLEIATNNYYLKMKHEFNKR
tara:strand:- start:8569 stop:9723 length:1155 start_codon:yes stop_codon:yes gene_type:complete